ncbi:MAG: type III pantothenate kinase [Bacteroidota bacterium]|nr:type III pantothenate kinase [Bacteroidota bacterium]MDP4204975.1 type III pantothenate kinase [Bacteroidota bacterium]
MNLTIDIGNTRTKIGLFNQNELMLTFPVDHLGTKELTLLKDEYPSINAAILSSTVNYSEEIDSLLGEMFDTYIKYTHQTPVPIKNTYESPETLGLDRLAAAIGANTLYPQQDILVVDAGTAITFEIINNNCYTGGCISPGLSMRFKALSQFTGRLPLIDQNGSLGIPGKNTQEAIRTGVVQGIRGEIESYITLLNNKYPDLKTILTGGDAIFFAGLLKSSIFVNMNLTLIGLNRILEYNAH